MSEPAEIQVLSQSEQVLHVRHIWTPNYSGPSFAAIAIVAVIISFLFSDWPITVEDWLWFFGQLAVMLYIAAAFCFNHTDVHADRQRIRWRHRPIPLLPGGEVRLDQIHDVSAYTKKRRYKVALRLKGGAFRIVFISIHSGAAAQQAAAAIARHAHLPASLP